MTTGDRDHFLTGIPSWARAIAIIGIPGAIALWLVWIGGNTLPALQREIIVMNGQIAHTNELLNQSKADSQELYRLMQRVCAAASRSEDVRNSCFAR